MVRLRPQLPPEYLAITQDPWGRTVGLSHRAMEHIAEHGELDGSHLLIVTTVEQAEYRTRGKINGEPVPDREVLWARNLGPSGRWMRVVVRYKERKGVVITAYAGKEDPEVADLL